MYCLQPLALTSVFKTILFTFLSLENFSYYLTIAAADVSIRGAHLGTYAGLSRAGLQLPVSSFLPPPGPVTSTDIALYITPVAAVSLRPTVDAFNTLLAAVPDITATTTSSIVTLTRRTFARAYGRYAHLMAHTQPLWGRTNSIGWSYGNRTYDYQYAYDRFPLFLSARTHLPTQPPPFSNSSSAATSPHLDLHDLYKVVFYVHGTHIEFPSHILPFEPSPAGYRAPTSAAVSLGQCTPYRVLPAQVAITLATDALDKPNPEIEYYARISDESEPEEAPKEVIVYEYPPCMPGSCELVKFVEPSEVVDEEGLLICELILLYSHVCVVVWTYLIAIRLVRWICRVLFVVLIFVCAFAMILYEELVAFITGICACFSANAPDLELAAESARSEPVQHKAKSTKKVRFDPASIPLPKDDGSWETEPAPEPAASPLIPATELEPSSDHPAPSSPVPAPSGDPRAEDDGGEWSTVVKRKPWRPFPSPPRERANTRSGRVEK
ncbi:hypothetical protein RhiJN_19558 [Ceratobasidium sp. AG-Ba]|nr:hypothetical protein RhiJN_19558 [Ceratobasidium sp. AG-Ba]QRW05610.1 hypothetical protein RhiLY_04609 [Ceratobasidium sp. AG-Ba]